MKVKINKNCIISNNVAPKIVAEISANHCGSKKNFLKHILSAHENGADMVKIQTYEAKDIIVNKNFKIKSGLWKDKNLHKLYKKAETPFEWHKEAFDLARKKNILLFSSPFSERAVDLLEKFNVKIYKLASFEITDLNLIKKIAKTKKPIIISTGLSNVKEIETAINIIKKKHSKIIILHCISGYPTPINEINLKKILLLKKKFKQYLIGISDHTIGIHASLAATMYEPVIIEKHFTLSKKSKSPDAKFSITPKELCKLKLAVNEFYKMIGSNNLKQITKSEKDSKFFRRSIYAIKNIKKNEILTRQNIASFRPLIGIGAESYDKIIGKKVRSNIFKGSSVFFRNLK